MGTHPARGCGGPFAHDHWKPCVVQALRKVRRISNAWLEIAVPTTSRAGTGVPPRASTTQQTPGVRDAARAHYQAVVRGARAAE